MGTGTIHCTSTRQKINTRSSTEAELIGVDDLSNKIVKTYLFLKHQGYDNGPAILYQDNKSAILLENNGKRSSTKRTRQLDIRYFYIMDLVHRGIVTIRYCPTSQMLADVLTKPLQGSLFRKMRDQLLGTPTMIINDSVENASPNHRSVLENVDINGGKPLTDISMRGKQGHYDSRSIQD